MEKISSIYTSDLRRARTTATILADGLSVDCYVRSSLREISFGEWEGLRWEEIEQRDEAYANRWIAEYPHLPAPGGEKFCDFERRVLDEVGFLQERAKERTLAVVTHAGVLRVVLCALHGLCERDAWDETRSYCCVVRHRIGEASFARSIGVES
jgi:broad specificity phosphatase PhoE